MAPTLLAGPVSRLRRKPTPKPLPRGVDVIAHRGASGWAPENTLAAVRLAHAEGATSVECDVHRTADGCLVVHHDATLARCTDAATSLPDAAPWRIADLTLDQLRRVDATSWFGSGAAPEPVPTLEEWVHAVGPRTGMLIEVKDPARYPGIEQGLAQLLFSLPAARAVHQAGRLTIQSFDHAWLARFKQRAPEVPVGLLTGTRPRGRDLVEAASWAEQVNPRARTVTRPIVERAHELGLQMRAWTVNDPLVMARLVEWRIDGIITNQPARLVGLLDAMGPSGP